MTSTIATAVVWPANTATPPPGWHRPTDTDRTQPPGWFTPGDGVFRPVARGSPPGDDPRGATPADLRHHDEGDDYAFLQGLFDLTSTTYVFPDLDTAAG